MNKVYLDIHGDNLLITLEDSVINYCEFMDDKCVKEFYVYLEQYLIRKGLIHYG